MRKNFSRSFSFAPIKYWIWPLQFDFLGLGECGGAPNKLRRSSFAGQIAEKSLVGYRYKVFVLFDETCAVERKSKQETNQSLPDTKVIGLFCEKSSLKSMELLQKVPFLQPGGLLLHY